MEKCRCGREIEDRWDECYNMRLKEKTLARIKDAVERSDMLLSSKAIGKEVNILHPYLQVGLKVLVGRGDIRRIDSSACVLYGKK